MASNRGHFLRSSKSSAEVPVFCPLSLVVNFPTGIFKNEYHEEVNSKYALFGLVWRSPKSAAEVTIALSLVWDFQKGISCKGKYALFGLVWFGGPPNQLQWSPLQCPWSGIFKKVYHVGVNMLYLVWFGLVVTQISCRGHHCNVLGLAFSKRYIM